MNKEVGLFLGQAETEPVDNGLILPHGGVLKELIVAPDRATELRKEAEALPFCFLTDRQTADLELLLNGALSPLEGFMGRQDYEAVCEEMRLGDGILWPIPIALDVPEDFALSLRPDLRITLRHPEGIILAVMTVTDVWRPDRMSEAERIYGTTDINHPGVFRLLHQTNPVYVGGRLEGLKLPPHHTFSHLRHTPAELREAFKMLGWQRVVGFQTRNPMHRVHFELTRRAMAEAEAGLLIHPTVGPTQPRDLEYYTRVRCYQAILDYYPQDKVKLSLLPLAMRMAGPREAVLHAIIRKNFGCTHFIIGRDHAGPKNNHTRNAVYEPYAAQALAQKCQKELGIQIIPFEEMVYVVEQEEYLPLSKVPQGSSVLSISGTELRRRLREGQEIPPWVSFPKILSILKERYPPRSEQGFTVFLTGLSGAGKSTIAKALASKLGEIGTRQVTLLDGDIVRRHLSSELGFSQEDRDTHVRRVGWIAEEVTKHHGAAICALIAPYRKTRREVREMIEAHGGFIEVHVATPLEVCKSRDQKGLYARAEAGLIENFTGISDPYELPPNPELTIDTSEVSPGEAADIILAYLAEQGFIKA